MIDQEEKEILKIPGRIKILIFSLIGLILFGTICFKFLLDVSFSKSFIITIEALAFTFHGESGMTRILAVFLALFGVILFWWALWSLLDILLEGNLTEYLKTRKNINKIRKMRDHYIIAGGGRVGEEIAKNLLKKKRHVVIIDKNEPAIIKLKKLGFSTIHGDVTDEAVLKDAGIQKASSLILAMPETEKNLLVTMSAREINPAIDIYARADKPEFVSKLKKAGAKIVIVPELAAAEKFLQELG